MKFAYDDKITNIFAVITINTSMSDYKMKDKITSALASPQHFDSRLYARPCSSLQTLKNKFHWFWTFPSLVSTLEHASTFPSVLPHVVSGTESNISILLYTFSHVWDFALCNLLYHFVLSDQKWTFGSVSKRAEQLIKQVYDNILASPTRGNKWNVRFRVDH